MKRMLMTMLLGVTILTTAVNLVFAESVYVTKNGKKYHNAESRFIKNIAGVEEISLEEAVKRGLQPSSEYLRYKERMESKKVEPKEVITKAEKK